ncbi:hypothetical protein TNCT_586721 [Trichonephila clavata]|uniref:Uncharacterized protein n=1 Tax=Trichonephila clavata TaxID=2740835 RepID=A0A8X6GQY5_TRICU|nr:hypothetical protein TNCT_586721 [Trichonephila clavata]
MIGQEEEGWWSSKTGLEQKLIILSTLLFIVTFALVITVAVLKNQSKSGDPCPTTVAPTTAPTGSTESTTVTADPSPTTSVDPSQTTSVDPSQTTSVDPSTSVSSEPSTEPQSSPDLSSTTTTTKPKPEEPENPKPEDPAKDKSTQQVNSPLILSSDPIKMEKTFPSKDINKELLKIVGA